MNLDRAETTAMTPSRTRSVGTLAGQLALQLGHWMAQEAEQGGTTYVYIMEIMEGTH